MNWSNLLRFRKQVEDLAREEVILAEWKKSRERSKRENLQEELHEIAVDLDRNLSTGMEAAFAEQRFDWLEKTSSALESQSLKLQALDRNLASLKDKLKKAYQARRLVELVIAKREAAYLREIARKEQRLMEESAVRKYFSTSFDVLDKEAV